MARVKRLTTTLAALATLVVGVAGCSVPTAPTTSPAATAAPTATVADVSWPGTGYVLTMPAGSVEITEAMKQQLADDPAAEDIEIVGSAPEGLPVVMTLLMVDAAAELDAEAYAAAQEETGLTDVREVAPVTLDGVAAAGVTGAQPDGLRTLSYLAPRGDDLVVVMFLSPDDASLQPVVDHVVAHFRWS